jgi:hypothetical protein
VFGPLIDKSDIVTGIDKASGDTTAISAGAEDRDFLRHAFPAAILLGTVFYVRDKLIRATEAGGKNNATGRLNDLHISAMCRLESAITAVSWLLFVIPSRPYLHFGLAKHSRF